jgi:pyruvate dehydrogenase E2 component (dihydrolipoamide acetyltransferase)
MPIAIPTPRINNNDDFVRFSRIHCQPRSRVRKGDLIAEIETDKASVTIEAEQEGFVLGFTYPLGEMIPVGSVLAWLGQSPDESIPAAATNTTEKRATGEPSLKAALLLTRFGLTAADVPASGERLTADDVLAYVQRHNLGGDAEAPLPTRIETAPDIAPGKHVPLSVIERGMLRTVTWHRDNAVAGYVEIEYDATPWDRHAAAFQQEHRLLLNPLLPLMAHRLVQLAMQNPKVNSTIVGDGRHEYSAVNLGFTLQVGTTLSLLCVRDAERLGVPEFVEALSVLMRQGMKGKLTIAETSGITISFSSMSRWQVTRHVPVLPPYTSLIIAHAHDREGTAALGASYDHRVLTGGEVAVFLRALSTPMKETTTREHSRENQTESPADCQRSGT